MMSVLSGSESSAGLHQVSLFFRVFRAHVKVTCEIY